MNALTVFDWFRSPKPAPAPQKLPVLSLCDYTGNMVRPWIEAGHKAYIVDTKHPAGFNWDGNLCRVGMDVRKFLWQDPLPVVGAVFAFPPCTDLAVSGARWFEAKGPQALQDALELVHTCVAIAGTTGAPWMLENPVGRLSTHWRKPDAYFNPCDYAGYHPTDPQEDAYTKKTCLWIGSGFKVPEPRPVEPVLGSKMHLLPPSPDRGDLRSVTPLGFAYAVYAANTGQQLAPYVPPVVLGATHGPRTKADAAMDEHYSDWRNKFAS